MGKNNVLTNKSVQLANYVDSINIMRRAKNAAEGTYLEFKENAYSIGLKINIDKTNIYSRLEDKETMEQLTNQKGG